MTVPAVGTGITKGALEDLYARLNRPDLIHPDPLEVLYDYPDLADREIAGFVAACLSYGRVKSILASVRTVLSRMVSPRRFLAEATPGALEAAFAGFRHRFATGRELAPLLLGVKRLVERHGSLNAAFVAHMNAGGTPGAVRQLPSADNPQSAIRNPQLLPALTAFVAELREAAGGLDAHLLPWPTRGSACKRLNLFLRWMVRRDAVDPGGWDAVSPAQLLVPLDVHMHRICRALGLTRRSSADLRTAIEITNAFKAFAPDDPVRYDFALTRLGIRPDADLDAFLAKWGTQES